MPCSVLINWSNTAGRWLPPMFAVDQNGTARLYFPKGYSRELPRLAHGPSKGLPRVYYLVLAVISHGNGRVDEETLTRFVAA
jgi:hypothetical protein